MKKALITGVTGQDGSYLAELLLEKDYEVFGMVRRSSTSSTERIDHLKNLQLLEGDLSDQSSLDRIMKRCMPDEVYNLAAQSHVGTSFQTPEYTADVTGLGPLRVLEAIRTNKLFNTRFYQASTSELFGKVQESPQKESTPFYPRSPYGVAKLHAHWTTINYRESYDIHASNGILFNHESPRRGENFVTRKITKQLAKICSGNQDVLSLGNLEAKRDWGHAKDYVQAMWLMLQQDDPDDYVIATGVQHSVRDFVEAATLKLGIELEWEGTGIDEVGIVTSSYQQPNINIGQTLINVNPEFYRPAEVETLVGDNMKAMTTLSWVPRITFQELVGEMMTNDLYSEKEMYQ